jgi:peptidoglycan pentaglycine glycine transferase (the first glycine)
MNSQNNESCDRNSWNSLITSFPQSHILQTYEWGQLKSQFGWQPIYKIWYNDNQIIGAALILSRTVGMKFLPLKWRVMYVPKGPLLIDWSNTTHREIVLNGLRLLAEENQALFIKIDPDINTGFGLSGEEGYTETEIGKAILEQLRSTGWLFSNEQIQFKNTVTIDLSQDVSALLSNMKQKARYNLRLAERKGVTIRMGDERDFNLLFQMYAETAIRDGFIIREKSYYLSLWRLFFQAGMAHLIIADYDGKAIAALLLFHLANKSWFLYGMSSAIHRDKMPNYLLQWEAIKYSKSLGCDEYDMWGAPDEYIESDPLLNVYRFKQGFGGRVVRHIGAWDLPIKPAQYLLYTQLLPKILSFWRWRSRKSYTQLAG